MELYEVKSGESRKDYALRVIKENIISLNLKPGEVLKSENYLSKQLGVSRTPLREVIMKLKNEDLIEVKSHVGMTVKYIDWDLINEIKFMKNIFEKEVLKNCVENLSKDILLKLEKNLYLQKLSIHLNESDEEFKKLDEEFHELLYAGANKTTLWNLNLKSNDNYKRFVNLATDTYDKKKIYKEHIRYFDIIKNKRFDEIDEIVNIHIEERFKLMKKEIKDNLDKKRYIRNYINL